MSPKTSELFKVTFIGELVEIIADSDSSEHGKLVIQGYLLDYDEDYYYLGEGPLAVTSALKRELVGFVTIINKVDPGIEVLQNMPEPTDDEVM